MKDKINFSDQFGAQVERARGVHSQFDPKGYFLVECFDEDGNLKWQAEIHNVIVNEGKDDILEQYFNGATYTASHFVGLTDGTPTVAPGDDMTTHAGWTEITAYSEATRPAYDPAAASGQSITNSASKASFSINGTATVGGAFITTDNTKGGTAGTLIAGGAFSTGDQGVNSGDTLNVTYQVDA